MEAGIRAAESEEHRQHIKDLKAIHALQEKEKREKKLKRKEISASERPRTVTEEVQSLNDFVDAMIVDPEEASASKGPSKVSPVKPTKISKPPVPPQRVRPFQELYDKLIKDTGPSVAKEICLLKNQVNDTNLLREKIKDQRKKNKEMTAYMAKQSKFIRFQQAGLEKMYRMMRNMCEQMKVKPMFSFEEIFDFEGFVEEENTRKEKEAEAKKKRLESVDKVSEGNESDEEAVDRDDMPAKFLEWGLEDEVLYEQENGKTFAPEHPEWFKKEREQLPDFYQVITVEKTEATDKIISWMYENVRGMFVVKRRGGVIQYFQTGFDLFSLPRWDLRELGRLDILNPEERGIGRDFERIIAKESNRVSRIMLRSVQDAESQKQPSIHRTGEAVIRSNENVDIRILDPMDVFMFGLSDLTILNASRINVGAGNANMEEAALFQRAVERAWNLKRKMLDLVDKIEKRKEKEDKKREARKKKKHERKKEGTSASATEPTTTSPPPASSTYEATKEDQPICEAAITQETSVTPTETQAPPETTVHEDSPKEPEKQATENPAATTEE
ncbi:uncharacterized protein LOC110893021 [Helianthus annuus]|uniref:uncharacterized protein LOC110893021 n=1 Tax=Helianthus annuus TaxID=4232 RepID=UPI000B8F4D4D|nr:uncharacterized protein LOC110893021 [Helianthus annuus]